jgi:hypothetical protein
MTDRRKRVLAMCMIGLILATLLSGGGAVVQSHLDSAAVVVADRIRTTDQLKKDAASKEKIALLEGIIRDERKRNDEESERRQHHDLLTGAHHQRVRRELEAAVSESRTNTHRCAANADRIASIALRALNTLDQAAAGVDQLEKRDAALAERNRALESKLDEWEQYAPEQITVIGHAR